MLGGLDLVSLGPVRRYLLEKVQHLVMGGFGKLPKDPADIYHAYLGLATLALIDGNKAEHAVIGPDIENNGRWNTSEQDSTLMNDESKVRTLRTLDPVLCISTRASKRLETVKVLA